MSNKMSNWVGLDVGGQSIKACRVDRDGKVIADTRAPTGEDFGLDAFESTIRDILAELGDQDSNSAIGIGIAGCVSRDGVVGGCPNLPRLTGVSLQRELGRRLGRPVVVDNDAHCHALAEGWIGAASNVSDFFLIAVGTGLGSALVLDGHVHRGTTGYGSELGHQIVEFDGRICGCQNQGCFEAYVSEAALESIVIEREPQFCDAVAERRKAEGFGLARTLVEMSNEGSAAASEILTDMVRVMGIGLASAVNSFDVPFIVIGGGLAPVFQAKIDSMRKAMDAYLFARDADDVELRFASAGAWAGAIGAAALARRSR